MQRWAQNETCQYYFDELHSKYLIDLFYEIRFTTQYKNILGELSIYFENSSEDRIRFSFAVI